MLKWGLIPSWAKDSALGAKLINPRSETVEEKPSLREAFKRRLRDATYFPTNFTVRIFLRSFGRV